MKRAAMPWVALPAAQLVETLQQLRWRSDPESSPARDLAALMIYVAFLFVRAERTIEDIGPQGQTIEKKEWRVSMSYDELEKATDLSRSLIAQGIKRLVSLQLVTPIGSPQQREYVLPSQPGRWVKLPCRTVFKQGEIIPFKSLSLRSKHDLHALKLYLYLASVRDGQRAYSEAQYETIKDRLGIQVRDIRKAISVLITCGLLQQVDRSGTQQEKYGANQYYLTGYKDLFIGT